MGNCVKSSGSSKHKHNHSKISNDSLGTFAYPQSTDEEIKSCQNPRKAIKTKGPIADARNQNFEDSDAPTAEILDRPKTKKDKNELEKILLSHSLFNSLSHENVSLVIDQMKFYLLHPKQAIFNQGDHGNNFFIISSGKVEVIVNGETKGILTKGKCFGELALLHNSERTATIKTIDRVTLWGIGRQEFRTAIEKVNSNKYKENKQFIDSVPILSLLTPQQKDLLLSVVISQEFLHGQKIVIEGDPGDLLYIIKKGTVCCTVKGKEIRQLSHGEFFGEQALLYNTQRTATVTAISAVTVLSLGREDLTRVLGNQLQGIIYRNSQRISIENSRTLKILTKSQIELVIEKMQICTYTDGQVVIQRNFPKQQKIWMVLKGCLISEDKSRIVNVFECIGDEDSHHSSKKKYDSEFKCVGKSDIAEISWLDLEECIGGSLSNIASQNEVLSILRKVQLLRSLSMNKLEALASKIKVRHFENQEPIFNQNDEGDDFYIVKEGQVDIVKDGIHIRTITRSDFFGERSMISNERRTASVIAHGKNVSCWVLEKHNFLGMIDEGIRNQLIKRINLQDDSVALADLCPIKVLGKGMFGNVFLTINKKTGMPYAIKTVSRAKVSAFGISDDLVSERKILLQIDHPLIMKLVKTFKDEERVYFLMEYVRGKDLFDVLRVLNLLTDDDAKFYSACIFLMLEHLHERRIIHRDLKPENIMVDEEGYPKMIDFGTTKIVEGRTYTVVGTPHYMAPEVISGKGYGLSSDYWSVGIMIYEFLCGGVPFGEEEEDPYRVYEKVLERKLAYPKCVGFKLKAAPIIEHLLNKNPAMRGTVESIKALPWFQNINWDKLIGKQIKPPHVPKLENLATDIERGIQKNKKLINFIRKEESAEHHEILRKSVKAPPSNWDEDF